MYFNCIMRIINSQPFLSLFFLLECCLSSLSIKQLWLLKIDHTLWSEKYHSLPNVCASESGVSELDIKRLYSLSLSHIKKHAEFAEYHHKPSPFNLRWVHGYNQKAGAINLNDRGTTTVFYAASNCGILYNWTTNQMRILQGHKHMLTCIAADSQGKWLVTADSGPENIIIIWDSSDYFPQRTLFAPHGESRVAMVALSAGAEYLLTMAYLHDKAHIYWWIWSYGKDEPHATLELEALHKDSIVAMGFNPINSDQFLLMTKTDIWIGVSAKVFISERGQTKETDDYELKIRMPTKVTHPDIGKYTCYTFVGSTSQILVATSRGSVVVYGYTIEFQQNVDCTNMELLKFIKVLKVEKHKINVIKHIDGVVVTGNDVGEIRFYDEQMKLMYWVHGFQVDCVKGLSFNISPRSYMVLDPKCRKICLCYERVVAQVDPETGLVRQKLLKHKLPSDATTGGKPFVVRDFTVCTKNQGIGFVEFVNEKLETILDYKISPALSLTVHPDKPLVCVGYVSGVVELINFVKHKLFTRMDLRDFYKVVIPPKDDSIKSNYEVTVPRLSVTCLQYSPSGLHLACGLNTGQLLFLDPTTIDIVTKPPFTDTKHEIKIITYSQDSMTMAMADEQRTVCVYKYDRQRLAWVFVGKHRAHYKDITSLLFLPKKNDNGDFKLISLGSDRVMVEYDIGQSSDEYLEIFSLDRVEQTAVPLHGLVWPPPPNMDPLEFRTNLPIILVANDEFKYKLVNYETTMTLCTVLGPRYDHPVCKVQLVSRTEGGETLKYLLFATKDIIGLQKMPLDGNPWKHTGLLGHPNKILQMCYREDIGTLFTIGARDNCMSQWAANYRSVDASTKLGGGDLDPYYCLIENGRPGWLFQEIRDLFYYIQILYQGTFSPAMRRVKDYIPIDALPDLMRALGFFPSEYEVENLLIEAKYKVYLRTPVTEINFEEFVKLYLNHRPAYGDNIQRLRNAFKHFADLTKDTYAIYKDDFIDTLTILGECFPRELSWYLLSILSGQSFEERADKLEDFSFLPDPITFDHFVNYIMGIQDLESVSEQHSVPESQGSQQTGSTIDSEEK